jgi:hypothetical protein
MFFGYLPVGVVAKNPSDQKRAYAGRAIGLLKAPDWIKADLQDAARNQPQNAEAYFGIPLLRRIVWQAIGSVRSSCASLVAMMKPAHFRDLNDSALVGRLHFSCIR